MITCPEKPELLLGAPIGMYHCPVCGMMVIAGLPHPEPDSDEDIRAELESDKI